MPAPRPVDIFQWDVRSWSRALPVWQRHLRQAAGPGGSALALGERDGGLSLLLAAHGLRTLCTDLKGPTDQARVLHEAHDLAHLVTYATVDVLSIPHANGSFDVVTFKSMLGALGSKERQVQAIAEMHRVLKPGGVLLFAENLRGTALHRWLRRRFVPWAHYWRYLDRFSDRDLFSAFHTLDEGSTGLLASLGRSEAQRDLLARLDGLLAPLVPGRWHTIWYGVAVKDT